MLSTFIGALQNANLDMSAEEIADILWLTLQMVSPEEEVESTWDSHASYKSVLDGVVLDQQSPLPLLASSVKEAPINVSLHTHHRVDEAITVVSGAPFRSPAAPALPNALALLRALRPFMRRVASKNTLVFNEYATVQRIAESRKRLWFPVFDPAPARWFDIELVIDAGVSMLFWKENIAELQKLLEQLGAFRNIRIWKLITDNKDYVNIYAGSNSAQEQAQARNPKELINPGGHRLLLIVSDCVSLAWHSGKVQELLELWGQKNLVTLLQMLPRRLWAQTALVHADIVRIHSSWSEVSNRCLKVKNTLRQFNESSSLVSSLPLPIVTLEASSLSSWTSVVVGIKKAWVTGAIFEQSFANVIANDKRSHLQVSEDAFSPKERVQQFRVNSSSLARKLAGLLAAAPIPISLPIVRVVQSTMLQEASHIHMAEVFLGGLLKEIYRDEVDQDPNQIQYDFIAGVRDELINSVPVPDAYRVLSETSQFVQNRYGQQRNFQAYVVASHGDINQSVSIAKGSLPFAYLELSALRRFGGEFVSFVDNIESQIARWNEQQDEPYKEDSDLQQAVLDTIPEKKSIPVNIVNQSSSFLSETWCDFTWSSWLPLNSPRLPNGSGIYRIKAIQGNEIFYIGLSSRNLRSRIGDLYHNAMFDTVEFDDPYVSAPSLWPWRHEMGIDFECSTLLFPPSERLKALSHYLLWRYRLEKGSSTLINHGRSHPLYGKFPNRGNRYGYRLPKSQSKPASDPSFPPLPLIGTSLDRTWMGLIWNEFNPLYLINKSDLVSSPVCYKIFDRDSDQLIFVGVSRNLRDSFLSEVRKDWGCPNPIFAFSALSHDILPHQLLEVKNDLIGGHYAQKNSAPLFQFKDFQTELEEL